MPIICFCNQVTDKEIRSVLKKNPAYGLTEIQSITNASTRCGKCQNEVTAIINAATVNQDFTQLKFQFK